MRGEVRGEAPTAAVAHIFGHFVALVETHGHGGAHSHDRGPGVSGGGSPPPPAQLTC